MHVKRYSHHVHILGGNLTIVMNQNLYSVYIGGGIDSLKVVNADRIDWVYNNFEILFKIDSTDTLACILS